MPQQNTSAAYDLRDWLEKVDKVGQLRTVEGASAEQDIGDATDLLQHRVDAPAVIFGGIPGYQPGFRVLVNGLGGVDRMALALGAPLGLTRLQLSEFWRERILNRTPLKAVEVDTGPVMDNVQTGDEVDMTIFPAPLWHPGDGGPLPGNRVLRRHPRPRRRLGERRHVPRDGARRPSARLLHLAGQARAD